MQMITHIAGAKLPDGRQHCTRCYVRIDGGERYKGGSGWPVGALVDMGRNHSASRVAEGAQPKGRPCIERIGKREAPAGMTAAQVRGDA